MHHALGQEQHTGATELTAYTNPQWFFAYLSVLSTVFLFALDGTIVSAPLTALL